MLLLSVERWALSVEDLRVLKLFQFAFFAVVFSCSAAVVAELPPLIPRDIIFGNAQQSQAQISPDGARLSWLAPDKSGVANVWVMPFGETNAQPVTNESHRPIRWYAWAADSKHILYLQDNGGDEIDHLFSTDLTTSIVRDLTPFRGVRAQNVMLDLNYQKDVLVALNMRDRHLFDIFRIDLETGAITSEARNPGDVLTWTADNNFVIRAATAFDGKTGATIIRVRDGADKPWRDLVSMPFERALFNGQVVNGSLIAGFDPDGKSLIIHSALDSDKGQLVRVDLGDGKKLGVLAEDPGSDIADKDTDYSNEPNVLRHPVTHGIQAAEFMRTNSRWVSVDPAVKTDLEMIGKDVAGFPDLVSRDRADQKWIIKLRRSDDAPTYYGFDRGSKKLSKLFNVRPELSRFILASKKPLTIKSHDGLELVSYLTTPPGLEARKLPLVLLIHGGPWYRDDDKYDPEVQFLANRGYAVLQVNYRGSTGFGIQFLNAGTNEWGRGTQQDLFDAAQWTIDQGIADPKRIAAMGWSGGGFATLLALEMKPEMFACGVDGVGPADLASLYRSFPSYWSNIITRWRRRGGDFDHNEQLNRQVSPMFHVDKIRSPLLIGQGQNDPRVTIANSDGIVAALRKAKRDVLYVVYPDEGHGFERPENKIDFYGRVEEFLAKHLGGRAEPPTKVPGATAELR